MPETEPESPSKSQPPAWIPPMKAVSKTEVPSGPGWAAELKWDGMRIQAAIGEPTASGPEQTTAMILRSSNGRDVTGSFPELAPLAEALQVSAVLDGEVVVFDDERPSFSRLQQRIHIDRPNSRLLQAHPVVYLVFDLLMLDGNSLLSIPYQTRRQLLSDLLPEGATWRSPPYLIDDAASLLQLAADRHLEGIVVKRVDSVYEPGARNSSWQKIKIRRRQEFVVGGWLPGQGSLENQLGSLVVGVYEGSDLVMVGRVGSGLTDIERKRLVGKLTPQADTPFTTVAPLDKVPVWVEPTVVVEVEYGEWPTGAMLRHPVYCGVRTDREPSQVVREEQP